ncbi:pentapeptide repeat-containing protein [Listeria monocytogenes]|nr:pentapeptide repeat-containing protein [Listeria monocytogenes]
MNQEELDIILENHGKWLRNEGGEKADLTNANLTNANLTNADLTGADLTNADLNWVKWQDVRGLTVVAVQVDTTRKNNQIAYIKELHIWTTGCFQGKLYKLKASIEKKHGDNEKLRKRYYRVIDFILREAKE